MRILIYGAGVIGEKSMKNEEYKKIFKCISSHGNNRDRLCQFMGTSADCFRCLIAIHNRHLQIKSHTRIQSHPHHKSIFS